MGSNKSSRAEVGRAERSRRASRRICYIVDSVLRKRAAPLDLELRLLGVRIRGTKSDVVSKRSGMRSAQSHFSLACGSNT